MKNIKKKFKSKLELACLNNFLRPALNAIIFEDDYLVCTNGHLLIRQKLHLHGFTEEEIKQLNGHYINRNEFKEINRYDTIKVENNNFVCIKKDATIKIELRDNNELNYPNYKNVIPNIKEITEINKIGISMKNLSIISKIILNDRAEFRFFGKHKAILIKSTNLSWNKELIMLMPVSLNY